MEVSGITATPAATPAPGSSQGATAKLAENFDNFLQLLTTQLKFQDPTEPMKSNEFINQLVQFSEVEQSINTNKKLAQLLDMQTANQTTAGLNYLGTVVEATGDTAPLKNGRAEFSYTLDKAADAALIVISDENGKVVYSAPGETAAGKHSFVWDGIDGKGAAAPEGSYRITVTARDADSQLIEVATAAVGEVTGVETGEAGVLLSLGGVKVPIGDVRSVRAAPPPAP